MSSQLVYGDGLDDIKDFMRGAVKGSVSKDTKIPYETTSDLVYCNITLHVHFYYCMVHVCASFTMYPICQPPCPDFFSKVIFLFPFSYLQVPLLLHFIHLLSAPSSSFLLCQTGLSLHHSLFLQSFPNRYVFFLLINFYSHFNQLIWVLAFLYSRLTTPLSILFVFYGFHYFFSSALSFRLSFSCPSSPALEYISPYSFILLSFWANAFFLLSPFISFSCSLRQLLTFFSLFPISLTSFPSPFPQASSSPHLKFLLDYPLEYVNLRVTCRTKLFVSYKQTWFVMCTIQYV